MVSLIMCWGNGFMIRLTLDNGTVHYYATGDIMEGDLKEFLSHIPISPDMVYSDPPWSDGNCKYWRTIANRDNKNIRTYQLKYRNFLKCLKEQLPQDIHLFIEGSKHHYNVLENVFKNNYLYYKTFRVYYHLNKEQILSVFDNKPIRIDLTGMVDLEYVNTAFEYTQPQAVLDPCVGLGITATTAYTHNTNFIGFDLNNTRLNRTIQLFKDYIITKDEYVI